MKKTTLIVLALIGLIASGALVPSEAARKGSGKGGSPAAIPTLTATETDDLLFMREEEKLARDVYITFYNKYERRIFNNISQSEQKHMNALLSLLVKYGLDDPALGFGQFSDPELQSLFDTLVAKGRTSELEALLVGALIEEVDMEDIIHAIQRTEETNIQRVYKNLLAGSENHMNAFVGLIEKITGTPYVAQWITQEEVDAILGR